MSATEVYPPIHLDGPEGKCLSVTNLRELVEQAQEGLVEMIDVHGAPATGVPLLTNGHLGADLLFVEPGASFPLHVHAGHHLLLCVRGAGTVTFDGRKIPIRPGDLYMIEGGIEHAVGADPDGEGHWLVAFGAPHSRLDSHKRMEIVEEGE